MDLSHEIIEYQKKTNSNDTQLAFEIHLSVERLHTLKNNSSLATPDEEKRILDFIRMHR
ncbi:LBP_cg2779 family protein [Lactobacillus sp. YT155]|uniref:LBP_cg2779 family protein n=1 Tax=Lactobacillus sp. YT155 TaxID=3060955 RepID=UPI00265F101D|nr:LBP_cg2779 family protein [Lactobacillus sp. YT155]MDO1605450.1 LBP_cg2779 family protein [Lactobacillus sp. YT155]